MVTTLILIGHPAYKAYAPDCVFIDEAAQADEPEAAIAFSYLGQGKQLVLSGDPQQLGPIFLSQISKKYGFGIYFLR